MNRPHQGPRTFRAPGRLTLMGVEVEPHDGFVLPFATDLEVRVTATARDDRRVRVHSLALRASAELGLDDPRVPTSLKSWSDFLRAVFHVLEDSGHALRGADLLIESTLPMEAGLASSSALAIAAGWALLATSGESVDRMELVHAARLAEQAYFGVRCGLAGPYAAVFGLRDHALAIDGRSIESTLVPVPTHAAAFVVCDNRDRRPPSDQAFALRRRECQSALAAIRSARPGVRSLRDVELNDLSRAQLTAAQFRRCRHVVTEDARVLAAAEALRSGDVAQMGWLMRQSQESLRLDYEATTEKIDALVAIANDFPGIYGSRMTGAGFGGSTLHLADPASVERFQTIVVDRYRDLFGEPLEARVLYPSDGAGEVEYPA